MNDNQLYFAIGIPVFAIVVDMITMSFQVNSINARFTSLEARSTLSRLGYRDR